jgi:hypothetical protein
MTIGTTDKIPIKKSAKDAQQSANDYQSIVLKKTTHIIKIFFLWNQLPT